jgi:hypothetical protein
MLSFLNTVDEQNVRIDTSNKKIVTGKIYSQYIVAETHFCVNHIDREFFEKYYLLTNSTGKYLKVCPTFVNLGKSFNYDKNFEKVYSFQKKNYFIA